jgi:hypothetical protein
MIRLPGNGHTFTMNGVTYLIQLYCDIEIIPRVVYKNVVTRDYYSMNVNEWIKKEIKF